ncbi:MAG TPA: dihydrofolate reductase [Patescibacteria group bacterium]|nr:dihydrofolate reductase [Patescibacteria group bacterium]
MKISMIAAIGEGNRVLGKDNKLIWDIPEDMKFFRDTTRGHTVIMGRKTFESMGKPLPQRTNIVITRDESFNCHSERVSESTRRPRNKFGMTTCIVVHSMEEALAYAKNNDLRFMNNENEVFIIGGAQIYTAALSFADRLYLTIVHGQYDGDAFFPDYSEFKKVVSQRESEGNGYKYTFVTLERS